MKEPVVPNRSQPRPRLTTRAYFQIDLSASQRWPFSSLVNASIEPLSFSGSPPSSSPAASSVTLSFGPEPSSAVVMTGLLTHSIRRSDAPGLSDDTNAVISMVSVSASAGNTGLGRLKVSFSLPVLAFHAEDDGFAASVLLSTPEIAVASLSRLILSPSRQSAAAKRIARSISTAPLLQPASTTPGVDLALAISAPARSGSTV